MKRAVTTISTPFLSTSFVVDSPICFPVASKYPKWIAKEDHSKIETRKIGLAMTAKTLWMVSFILLQIVKVYHGVKRRARNGVDTTALLAPHFYSSLPWRTSFEYDWANESETTVSIKLLGDWMACSRRFLRTSDTNSAHDRA
jgi:hypothetical protein